MRAAWVCLGLLAVASIASASCPNQCSGHGRCNANDKCECYTQVNTPWGNRYMYTGADCSLRTCPIGAAPDGIANYNEGVGPFALTTAGTGRSTTTAQSLHVYLSSNLMLAGPSVTINVKVATYSSPSGTFQWKYAQDAATYYSQPIAFTIRDQAKAASDATDVMLLDPPYALNTYPGNGQTETGIRVYFDDDTSNIFVGDEYTVTITRPSGYHWVASNDNTLHQGAECSRRGLCDSTTGKCKCFTGFGGEACQRTTCPNDCSGHGTCQDEFHFRLDADNLAIVAAANKGYGSQANLYTDAFDASRQMGCKCDQGYRGPDCSLIECPSGNDPLVTSSAEEADEVARDCSGRGICDYTVGQCKCFKGYFGERCESQTNFV